MARQAMSDTHNAEFRTNTQPSGMLGTPAGGQERGGYPWACWVLRQVAKSGEAILTNTTSEKYSPEDDDLNVFTVFKTFSSNNRHKRALRDLTEINQVTALNPWNDMAITFNATDEPRARSV